MREDRDMLFQRIVRSLREPVRLRRDFDSRVMSAVTSMPRHTKRTFWSLLTTPQTITFTPLSWGLLAASVVVVAGYSLISRPSDTGRAGEGQARAAATAQAPGDTSAHSVQFVLVAPTARKVAVVGDFNGWDATHVAYQAKHRGGGVWSVMAPVPAGHHRYSFIVDDSLWVADPQAPRAVDKDFGVPNSAIVVGAQE
jgi:hypothetical protein